MRIVIDTPILIDFLHGVDAAREVLERADETWISIVTWLEVMARAETDEERKALEEFLESFNIQPLTMEVAQRAVELGRSLDVGLAEATIVATARHLGAELVTWSPNVVGGASRSREALKREAGKRGSKVPPPEK